MIYVKTALPGCGKTKWLLKRAYEAAHSGKYQTIVYCGSPDKYVRFCDKYLATFGEVPHLTIDSSTDIMNPSCVLIDDIFNNIDIQKAQFWLSAATDSYITINGETACNCKKNIENDDRYVQLSMFDQEGAE